MKVKWTKAALVDLQAIWDYIARDSLFYADKFIDELLLSTDILEDFPESGNIVPEISDSNTREIIHGSYRIMYHIREGNVFITQVTHGARKLPIH